MGGGGVSRARELHGPNAKGGWRRSVRLSLRGAFFNRDDGRNCLGEYPAEVEATIRIRPDVSCSIGGRDAFTNNLTQGPNGFNGEYFRGQFTHTRGRASCSAAMSPPVKCLAWTNSSHTIGSDPWPTQSCRNRLSLGR